MVRVWWWWWLRGGGQQSLLHIHDLITLCDRTVIPGTRTGPTDPSALGLTLTGRTTTADVPVCQVNEWICRCPCCSSFNRKLINRHITSTRDGHIPPNRWPLVNLGSKNQKSLCSKEWETVALCSPLANRDRNVNVFHSFQERGFCCLLPRLMNSQQFEGMCPVCCCYNPTYGL